MNTAAATRRAGAAADRKTAVLRATAALATVALAATLSCAHRSVPPGEAAATVALPCRDQIPNGASPAVWITPPDATDHDRLSRWCRTVGPVLFIPRPAHQPPDPTDDLAIVSWNIHEGGGDVLDVIRRLRAGEFTGGVPVVHFVLLLQEATRRSSAVPARITGGLPVPRRIAPSASRDADVQRLGDQGFALLYAPSMRNGEPPAGGESAAAEDRGNAIVSTLPLDQARLIELPLERQRRVAVAAAIEGRDASGARWRVDLVDVHLDTSMAWIHGGPFAARRRQVQALLDSLGESGSAADTLFTILGGDLNTWRGRREPAVRLLEQAFPDTPPAPHASTWLGPLGVRATLDHIFARGRFARASVNRLPQRFGSDHYPLLATVRLALH